MRSSSLRLSACALVVLLVSGCSAASRLLGASPGAACLPHADTTRAAVPVPGEPSDTAPVGGWLGRYQRHICRGGLAT